LPRWLILHVAAWMHGWLHGKALQTFVGGVSQRYSSMDWGMECDSWGVALSTACWRLPAADVLQVVVSVENTGKGFRHRDDDTHARVDC
jgi:hypothetical protein